MPWIDGSVNVQHIGGFGSQCSIVFVRFANRIGQIVSVEITSIEVGALLNEEIQRKSIAEQFLLFVRCLIEAEFVACLIGPLNF